MVGESAHHGAMTPYAMLKGRRGASGFGYASTAEEVTEGIDLHGKTILVAGVGAGLGQETARVLAMRGAKVLGAARTRDKALAALGSSAGGAGRVVPLACELSEPSSVRACVEQAAAHGPIDAIICNAGIMALRERTIVHGQELQCLTNHVGHFMLANLLFAQALAKRLRGTSRTANAVHPGIIPTSLTRHFSWDLRIAMKLASILATKNASQGAATQCYVATHGSLAGVSGEYFVDCNLGRSSKHGGDEAMAERLWEATEAIVDGLAR
jgi:NAD(P)-dependent dehydrogenase (short-subunit alcohol dehydrogenase family)